MLRISIFPLLLLIYNNVLYDVVHNNNCLKNFRLGNVRSKKDGWTLFVIYYRRVKEVK